MVSIYRINISVYTKSLQVVSIYQWVVDCEWTKHSRRKKRKKKSVLCLLCCCIENDSVYNVACVEKGTLA